MPAHALPQTLENFTDMQARYQALSFAKRAEMALEEAKPAFDTAETLLSTLETHPKLPIAIENLRKNQQTMAKIRASDAKTTLTDEKSDFIATTRHKLNLWRDTLQRVATGELKPSPQQRLLYTQPSATSHDASSYLAMLKLVMLEIASLAPEQQKAYETMLLDLRRCTTLLSDCECASELNNVVLH